MPSPAPDADAPVPPSPRTTVRYPGRGRYDRTEVDAILDEAPLVHVGFATPDGPTVIPMLHVRVGDVLYVHGAPATRLVRTLRQGVPVCATATLLDGWVLARSAFHHSANYRSAVVYGTASLVEAAEERAAVLDALVDKVVPGRRDSLRPTTDQEVRGTAAIRIPIDEASAKVRTGDPIDDPDDLTWPVWAGVVPVVTTLGTPIPSADLDASLR